MDNVAADGPAVSVRGRPIGECAHLPLSVRLWGNQHVYGDSGITEPGARSYAGTPEVITQNSLNGVVRYQVVRAPAGNVFHALGEARPHRPALQRAEAARVLASLPLDRAAVRAVLGAAGTSSAVLPSLPAGLTERELDVLRLLAAGRTKPHGPAVAARIN